MSKKKKRKSSDVKMMKKLDKVFSENYGERFGDEKITRVNIADADLEYSQLFGANKNLYRTIPSLISGLKPGATRLLYSWWELEGKPSNTKPETIRKLKSIKVDKLSANTVNYHPHGTVSIDELIGTLGQYWSNNVMLIVPQGSYGNCRGDSPAAGRYREAKLTEYTIDCFFDDFNNYCVPMKLAYTGDSYEPEYLPAKYPHVLFNPQFSSIGYGLSSNIPSFNFSEVIDATIKLIKNPKAKILLIPDSPTGCDIIDDGNFEEINKTGNSKLTMRASSEIDYVNSIIHITSLPINSMSSNVINKVIELKNKGQFDEIIEIKDYTVEGKVKIDFYLKKDCKPDKVLDNLYKKGTGLKSVFPVNITVIDDYQEFEYGVRELLVEWIIYRKDIVRSMMLNKLQSLLSKQHMNDVLLMVFNKDNIDTTIKIARTSTSRSIMVDRLMKQFSITSLQAGTIADMRVSNFNKDSYKRYEEERENLKAEIQKVNDILKNEDKLDDFIIKQLEDGKKKYGSPRRSKIVKEDDDLSDIPDIDYLVGISDTGFIKKIPVKDNVSIGSVGKTNSPIIAMVVNNRENILVVDSTGYVSKISISAIPEMKFDDIGIELNKFFSVNGSVKAVMEVPNSDILNVDDDKLTIIVLTKYGIGKRIKINELNKITDKKQLITLSKDDEVVAASFSLNITNKDIIIYTNKGTGIRLKIDDIRITKLNSKGTSVISLKNDELVSGMSLVNQKKKLIFYVTNIGKVKVTELKFFPVMSKNEKPINLIGLSERESLIGLATVDKNDVITIYKKKNGQENLDINSIPISTRIANGKKVISLDRSDCVIGFKAFTSK